MLFTFYFVICKFKVVFKVESTCIGLGGTTYIPALARSSSLSKMSQILTIYVCVSHYHILEFFNQKGIQEMVSLIRHVF